ncbi:hypothetical protein ACFST9_17150 [Hymenobacter monticola]|uniref:Uncharacterized protein n=1 Tax=Hymenobacter monticola TaxID=1705399 RepID=A0ABY4B0M5_9BACT|nr:hypothetical protein [Hymenobacter monticola]UOE32364.1 hypothetical protein MTP16_14630 [Hymenobacter monticola]
MKYYCKYSAEDSLWGVGLTYLEYDMASGEPLRQVDDYGNILFYSQPDVMTPKEQGTCYLTESSLALELQYEEDRVLPEVFEAKWARATAFYDSRLDVKKRYATGYEVTPEDAQELILKFNHLAR